MTKTYTMKASKDAKEELKRRVKSNPAFYKGRGMTGALDIALFGEFRTVGNGNNWGGKMLKKKHKNVEKKG